MIIDYIFVFPDEPTAQTVLTPFGFYQSYQDDTDQTMSVWDQSCCFPIRMVVGEKQVGVDDDQNPILAPVYAEGFWLVISTNQIRNELFDLPFCMREADRDKRLAGEPYILRDRFTPEQLAVSWSITPQIAGVVYNNDHDASVLVTNP